jgi:hypothetical protein
MQIIKFIKILSIINLFLFINFLYIGFIFNPYYVNTIFILIYSISNIIFSILSIYSIFKKRKEFFSYIEKNKKNILLLTFFFFTQFIFFISIIYYSFFVLIGDFHTPMIRYVANEKIMKNGMSAKSVYVRGSSLNDDTPEYIVEIGIYKQIFLIKRINSKCYEKGEFCIFK